MEGINTQVSLTRGWHENIRAEDQGFPWGAKTKPYSSQTATASANVKHEAGKFFRL